MNLTLATNDDLRLIKDQNQVSLVSIKDTGRMMARKIGNVTKHTDY